MCTVIVSSWCMQRKTPRCPVGEDARPRGVAIPRQGVNRAEPSLLETAAAERRILLSFTADLHLSGASGGTPSRREWT